MRRYYAPRQRACASFAAAPLRRAILLDACADTIKMILPAAAITRLRCRQREPTPPPFYVDADAAVPRRR